MERNVNKNNNVAAEKLNNSFMIHSPNLSASMLPNKSLLLTANSSLSNIQLPTQPLDISEVSEFSANNAALSSQPPPDVASSLGNMTKAKPSTVSLLRGMRLKKSFQVNGTKCKDKNDYLHSGTGKWLNHEDNKKMFVRPFEDNYSYGNKMNSNCETISEIKDMSYTPPEYKITENTILGDINVSIPVTLESNLKHINANHVKSTFSEGFDTNLANSMDLDGSKFSTELTNNNSIIFSKQVSLL